MKKFIAFALSAVMALSLAACGAAEKKEENAVQLPNPFTEYASMEEAAAAAGFDMSVPDTVDGSTQRTIQVLDTAENPMIEVIYHCGEGYATAEIAAILGRREATVRSDLRRGREKLKELLKEGYDL